MTNEPERFFGRLDAHGVGDDQDVAYSMSMALPAIPVVLPNFRYWPHFFPALDQGQTSTCVAHALKHWMQAAPVIQTSPTKPPFPKQVYRDLVLLDEWPSNDGEATAPDSGLVSGTSVRAAFKWAQGHKYVTEYRWALNPADLAQWVLTKGPVVIGVGWFDGMMNPDGQGFLYPVGALRGGHSVCVIGRNQIRGDYTILNSWGPMWGRGGRARIKDADLNRLIFEQGGEAAAGLEVRI